MRIVTTDGIDDAEIVRGEMVHAVAVSGTNIIRDMREAIVNTIGGHMTRYESLLDATIERALDNLKKRAEAAGYDGVLAVRLSHPMITNGAIEVVATGTGFRYAGRA